MKTWKIVAAATTAGLLPTGTVWAACEPFTATVPLDARHFELSDADGDGQVSPGDKLVGRDTLYDANGKEIGRLLPSQQWKGPTTRVLRGSGPTSRSTLFRRAASSRSTKSTARSWTFARWPQSDSSKTM